MIKLMVGDNAPYFEGVIDNGNVVKLSDYQDKKLILYFYPKDNTPGCTAEACSLRDGYSELKSMGYEILGVSPDNEKKHQGFISKHNLNFNLIADTDNKIATDYGVWGLKKFLGREYMGIMRTTFIIENSKITSIFDKVNTKNHFEQIVDSLKG